MNFLYRTLYFKDNPDAEYQYRGIGRWYKRKKDSNQEWYKVDREQQKYLQSYFKDSGRFFNYSTTAKLGALLIVGVVSYYVIKKYGVLSKLK
jgi:hypothetical protein